MCVIEGEETLVDVLDTAGQEEFRQVEAFFFLFEFAIICAHVLIFIASPFCFFLFLFSYFLFLVGWLFVGAPQQCDARALHARRGGIPLRVLSHGPGFV